MPPPMPPDKRAAIIAAIEACVDGTNEQSAGAIARAHDVAPSTVTKIAKQEGLDEAWQRTQTAAASRATAIDNRARRAALSSGMLEDAERLRARLWEPTTVVTATGSKVALELPPPGDARQLSSAITGFVKASLDIDGRDAEVEQHAAVDVWLRQVTGEPLE